MKSLFLALLIAFAFTTSSQAKGILDESSVSYFINPAFQDKIDKAKMSLDGPDEPIYPDFRGVELFSDYQTAINLAAKDGMKCQNMPEGFWTTSEVLGAEDSKVKPIAQRMIWCYIDPIKTHPNYTFIFTPLGRLAGLEHNFYSEEPPEQATKTLQEKFSDRKFSHECPLTGKESCFSPNRISGRMVGEDDETVIEFNFRNTDRKLINGKYNYQYSIGLYVRSEIGDADVNAMKEQLTNKSEFKKTDF